MATEPDLLMLSVVWGVMLLVTLGGFIFIMNVEVFVSPSKVALLLPRCRRWSHPAKAITYFSALAERTRNPLRTRVEYVPVSDVVMNLEFALPVADGAVTVSAHYRFAVASCYVDRLASLMDDDWCAVRRQLAEAFQATKMEHVNRQRVRREIRSCLQSVFPQINKADIVLS